MTEPTTAAGREMFADILEDHELDPRTILAIEQEAYARGVQDEHDRMVVLMSDARAIAVDMERERIADLVRKIDTADFNYEPAATAAIKSVLALLEEQP